MRERRFGAPTGSPGFPPTVLTALAVLAALVALTALVVRPRHGVSPVSTSALGTTTRRRGQGGGQAGKPPRLRWAPVLTRRHAPEAQGSLPPGPQRIIVRTLTSLGRAVCPVYVPCTVAPQVGTASYEHTLMRVHLRKTSPTRPASINAPQACGWAEADPGSGQPGARPEL